MTARQEYCGRPTALGERRDDFIPLDSRNDLATMAEILGDVARERRLKTRVVQSHAGFVQQQPSRLRIVTTRSTHVLSASRHRALCCERM